MYIRYLNNNDSNPDLVYEIKESPMHRAILDQYNKDLIFHSIDRQRFAPFDYNKYIARARIQKQTKLQKEVFELIEDLDWKIFLTLSFFNPNGDTLSTSFLEKCTNFTRKVMFDIGNDFGTKYNYFVRPAVSSLLHFHCLIGNKNDLWIKPSKRIFYPFPILNKRHLAEYIIFKLYYFWRPLSSEFKLSPSINLQLINPTTKKNVVAYTVHNRHKEDAFSHVDVSKHFIGDYKFFFHTNTLPKLTKDLQRKNERRRKEMFSYAKDFIFKYENGESVRWIDCGVNKNWLEDKYAKEKKFLEVGYYESMKPKYF